MPAVHDAMLGSHMTCSRGQKYVGLSVPGEPDDLLMMHQIVEVLGRNKEQPTDALHIHSDEPWISYEAADSFDGS